eukprot:328000-Amphidinium_carterae.1
MKLRNCSCHFSQAQQHGQHYMGSFPSGNLFTWENLAEMPCVCIVLNLQTQLLSTSQASNGDDTEKAL